MTTKYFTLKTITKVNISKWLCDVQATIFTILLLASYLIGMHYNQDNKVEKKINDPEFLIKLSTKVRPALIFDANETIHADMGADELISDLKVINKKVTPQGFPNWEIIITPTKHLPYPPIIESINGYEYTQTINRGKGHEWIYKLHFESGPGEDPIPRFRLEIIQQQ